jgi:hypothetical protein
VDKEFMKINVAFICLLVIHCVCEAQPQPSMSDIDRIRVAEAYRLGDVLGDRVWKNWSKAPFAVLLVTPEYEFLLRHPKPSSDFSIIRYDSLLKSNVYYRKRTMQLNSLATYPAVGGVSTIVVGQAENTQAKTSTPWVVTLLHEHFHQLQDSQPNSYQEINALNLSRGDQTGMWMLNYAFPYDTPAVANQFMALTRSLATAVQAKSKSEFSRELKSYLAIRQQLQQMLNQDDYNYFSFQLWKEGIARYTEYRIAREALKRYTPTKPFRGLKDFTSFDDVSQSIMSRILNELSTLKLEEYKRVAFYPIGAAEGLLLDRTNPKWQKRYFTQKFYLEKYFQ